MRSGRDINADTLVEFTMFTLLVAKFGPKFPYTVPDKLPLLYNTLKETAFYRILNLDVILLVQHSVN